MDPMKVTPYWRPFSGKLESQRPSPPVVCCLPADPDPGSVRHSVCVPEHSLVRYDREKRLKFAKIVARNSDELKFSANLMGYAPRTMQRPVNLPFFQSVSGKISN